MRALHDEARRTLYHGNVKPERLARLQRQVLDRMVDESLLHAEALRLGIEPDADRVGRAVARTVSAWERRDDWSTIRASVLPSLKAELERRDLLIQLRDRVRDLDRLTDPDVRRYYEENPEAFTEPERTRVSVVLLKVDPASPAEGWAQAMDEGAALVARLRTGASFEDTARLMSADASASVGGDLGYVHRGMLAAPAQTALDGLAVGQISDPVRVLQGVLVLRLDERRMARRLPFEETRDRARELARRAVAEQAWTGLIARLRDSTTIEVDETRLLPLPDKTVGQGASLGGSPPR